MKVSIKVGREPVPIKLLLSSFLLSLLSVGGCFSKSNSEPDHYLRRNVHLINVQFGNVKGIDAYWKVRAGRQLISIVYEGDDEAFDFSNESFVQLRSTDISDAPIPVFRLKKPKEVSGFPVDNKFHLEAQIDIDPKLVGRTLFIELLGPNQTLVFKKKFVVIE